MNPYIGNSLQYGGVVECTLKGGKQEGMRMLIIRNHAGLEAWVSLDRSGDIAFLSIWGTVVSYLTPNGFVHPSYYDGHGDGWLKTFGGGFFITCGYDNVGTSSVDEDGEHPLHGNVSTIPVSQYSYEINEKEIVVKTILLDESVFGRKIKRIRFLRFGMEENTIALEDEIINQGDQKTPIMVLYHCNLGYPLVQESSRLKIASTSVKPRNELAAKDIATWSDILPPQEGFIERCYYHQFKNEGVVTLDSPDVGIGMKMTFDPASLPEFVEWKMFGVRDYVLGLEPGNVNADGYAVNKKEGKLTYVQPGESLHYILNFDFYRC